MSCNDYDDQDFEYESKACNWGSTKAIDEGP